MDTPASPKSKARKRDRLDPRRVRIDGKTFWQVELGSEIRNGKRHRLRKTFAAHEEAQTFADLRKIERTNHGRAGLALSELERGECVQSNKLLEPYGDVSVLEIVREYVRRRELSSRSETTPAAFESFLAAKIGDGLRTRYTGELRTRLRPFVERFEDRKVASIQAQEIDRYLRGLGVAPVSRNTVRQRLSVFFEYCRQRGWVSTNPTLDVAKAKVPPSVPGILTVEQAARLLEIASEECLPFFAIGLFAGLRSAELERLQWHHVRFDERLIEVPALSSKTASRRLVAIQPNLAAWLKPYRDHHGQICPGNLYRRLEADREAAGILSWPSNALRHSYASYHLAAFRDAPALSLELGHVRPQTVFSNYREVVRPTQAERFWQIAPVTAAESKIAIVA